MIADTLHTDSLQASGVDVFNIPVSKFVKRDTTTFVAHVPRYPFESTAGMGSSFSLVEDTTHLSPILSIHSANPVAERPYNMASDDIVSGVIVVCLMMLFYVFGRSSRYLKQQAKLFFRRPRTDDSQFKVETGSEHRLVWFLSIQKCLIGALLTFFFLCRGVSGWFQNIPQLMLAIYAGCFAAYFVVKYLLTRFANWIFFDKVKKLNWKDSYSFISTTESLLFLPLALVAVYDDPPVVILAYVGAFVLISLKILLLYRTFSIFFGKLHCTLHLIVYFCTLELLPLTVLFASLVYLTNALIVK